MNQFMTTLGLKMPHDVIISMQTYFCARVLRRHAIVLLSYHVVIVLSLSSV